MKRLTMGVLILALLVGLTGCAQETQEEAIQEVTVILDWVPNTNHTGMYVAQAEGYYEELGLNVEIIQPTAGGSADLIAAGQGDFGISYQEQVTYARTTENPLPVKAIAAILQHNTSGFASPVDRGITRPKDFEGKKYGGWGSPMEVAILKGLMEADGGDYELLTQVDVGAIDYLTAVEEHVDFTWIYYGWDGVNTEMIDYPINFMLLQDVNPDLDFYTPVIIASEDYIAENPETVAKFIEATSKGYNYAIDNPQAAAEILVAAIPEIDHDLAVASQEYLADQYIADADKWGVMKESVWINYGRWMLENGLLESELDAKEAFTNEYLPE